MGRRLASLGTADRLGQGQQSVHQIRQRDVRIDVVAEPDRAVKGVDHPAPVEQRLGHAEIGVAQDHAQHQ